jgi:hypothetical protein
VSTRVTAAPAGIPKMQLLRDEHETMRAFLAEQAARMRMAAAVESEPGPDEATALAEAELEPAIPTIVAASKQTPTKPVRIVRASARSPLSILPPPGQLPSRRCRRRPTQSRRASRMPGCTPPRACRAGSGRQSETCSTSAIRQFRLGRSRRFDGCMFTLRRPRHELELPFVRRLTVELSIPPMRARGRGLSLDIIRQAALSLPRNHNRWIDNPCARRQ